jgi:SAM-dependent methyltransferase
MASNDSLNSLMNRVNARLKPEDFIEAVAITFQEVRSEGLRESMEQRFRSEPSFKSFQNAVQIARARGDVQSVCVLGCGRGFAGEPAEFASGVVRELWGAEKPHDLALFNVTPSMLRQYGDASFANQQNGFKEGQWDLVVVHSFLHYVPDVAPVFALIMRLLKPAGGLILSHEPNARFWQNTACQSAVAGLRKSRQDSLVRRYLKSAYGHLRGASKQPQTAWDKVNVRLKERYGLTKPLAENEIRRLVDVHRPEAIPGEFRIGLNGFDFDELSRFYLPGFRLESVATSGHLGYASSGILDPEWRKKENLLATEHPLAGCVFTGYWHRSPMGNQ